MARIVYDKTTTLGWRLVDAIVIALSFIVVGAIILMWYVAWMLLGWGIASLAYMEGVHPVVALFLTLIVIRLRDMERENPWYRFRKEKRQ